jgi:acetyl-CoA decarbonylase/synthase gamma subunit (EC 2.1.1.-)
MKAEHKKSIREISPIDVYKLLPRTNCAECGEANCMAFATKVVNGEAFIEGCPPVLTKNYEKDLLKLQELLAPPVRVIHFGTGNNQLKIGGKTCPVQA